MKVMATVADRYKRWRHIRGYGIHSPSAYTIIREVLRPPREYGYYAYDDLRKVVSPHKTFSELCLIYRLIVWFHPDNIAICASDSADVLTTVARMACPFSNTGTSTPQADFVIVDKDYSEPLPSEAKIMFFFDTRSQLAGDIRRTMTAGHIFDGNRHTIIVRRHDLPLQTFTLNI